MVDHDTVRAEATEPRWLAYLYEQHSPDELSRWARRLRSFRFRRAAGGHANDGDTLLAALRFSGEQALLELFDTLGIEPTWLPADNRRQNRARHMAGPNIENSSRRSTACLGWRNPGMSRSPEVGASSGYPSVGWTSP